MSSLSSHPSNGPKGVLLLTEEDVRRLLTMDMALEAVEQGLRKLALDEAMNTPRARVQTDHAMLHIMSASAKSLGVMGAKLYATSRKGGARFLLPLFDGKTGALLCLMQADYLGQVRTGAASGVATQLHGPAGRHRGRPLRQRQAGAHAGAGRLPGAAHPASAGLQPQRGTPPSVRRRDERGMSDRGGAGAPAGDGGGGQGHHHHGDDQPRAGALRPLDRRGHAHQRHRLELPGQSRAGQPPPCAAAPSSRWTARTRRASRRAISSKALEDGSLHWADVRELGQVIVGRYPGRKHPQDVTLFKSLGIAIEDVAVAARVYARAVAEGVGKTIEW